MDGLAWYMGPSQKSMAEAMQPQVGAALKDHVEKNLSIVEL